MGKKAADRLLKETLYFKILWAALVLLKINYIIDNRTAPLFMFLLVYGFAIILYDLFTDRNILRNRYTVFIVILLFFAGLSTLVNYKSGLIENIKLLISTTIQLFVIGMVDFKKPGEKTINEMRLVNKVLIIGITLFSLISLGMVIFGVNGTYTIVQKGMEGREIIYPYGIPDFGSNAGRLVGIYTNSNRHGVYVGIAIVCSLINLVLKKTNLYSKMGYILSILLNYICLILSDSRSSILSLYASAGVLLFGWLLIKFKKDKNAFIKYSKAAAICIIGVGLMYYSSGVTRDIFNNIKIEQNRIQGKDETQAEDEDEISEKTYIDFELGRGEGLESMGLGEYSSGRIRIWEIGLNAVKAKPIFGTGLTKMYDTVNQLWEEGPIPLAVRGGGMHNIYMEIMVSYGIPAFLAMMALLLIVAIRMFYRLSQGKKESGDGYLLGISILAMLAFILSNNLFESRMLFFTNISSFVFTLYLGWAMYFNQVGSVDKR